LIVLGAAVAIAIAMAVWSTVYYSTSTLSSSISYLMGVYCLYGGGAARRQHAVGYVTGDQFYGAKASLNVWPAQVASPAEFSLSQIWVISGSFGNDLNTIEAGWQVR
jgi:hypothetical protein